MGDFSVDKILLLVLFFVPGFIYLKVYRLFIAETKTDFSKDLYEAIGYSFINAIIYAYPLYLINLNDFIVDHSIFYFLIVFFIIIVSPILGACLFYSISKRKWFSKIMINPTKSSWDSFFSKRESYFVIVTLKNGRKICGKYGMNSFSSTYPNPKEIYLEEVWELNQNNGFGRKVEQTEGILITENEISTIEFFI